MTGSFIVSYLDDIEFGGDYLNISLNGTLQKRLYNYTTELYTIPLEIGDLVTIEYVPFGGFSSEFSLIRRDYTPNNEDADDGIKDTVIISAQPLTTYSFSVIIGSDASVHI